MYEQARKHPGPGVIDGSRAHELVARGARLIDVRTPSEFRDQHLEGSINVPLQDIETGLADLGDTKRSLIVYCRSGQRSARARRHLEDRGYTVFDMGTIDAW